MSACAVCEAALPPAPKRGGPPRIYCSARCRQERYSRAHGVQPRGRNAPHGGSGRRYEYGCRCDECRAAHARRKRLLRTKGLPPGAPHGINAYNNHGCRCDVCRAAKSAENAQYRASRQRLTKTPALCTTAEGDTA